MYIAIDIGGTSTRVALLHNLHEPALTLLSRFPTSSDYQQELTAITTALQTCVEQDFAGIGASIGGRMARDGRSVAVAPNLPAYVDKPLALDLERQWNCPVRLAHDTVCGLLAEKKFGALQQSERCAYVTLSTGTGAAIHLQKGAQALTVSIELGHQLLAGNHLPCLCGQVGCLETFTGGRQLELRLGHSTGQIADPAFWEGFCDKLALGLVNLAQLTRVETIALSGALILHNAFLLTLLQQRVTARIAGMALQLHLAHSGENAPLLGAATLLTTPEESIVH